jgi:hypothetical protein
MSLYQIQNELMPLLEMSQQENMETEMAEAFREHTAALIEAFDAKADDYAALIRTCESRADERLVEAERLQTLAARDKALADRLRNTLLEAMQATGRKRVETSRFALSVVQNGGKIPVQIHDETALPEQFKIPVWSTKIDKEAIRAALERGEAIDGAALGQRGTRLSLK